MHHARAGLELKPTSRLAVSGGYHSWWRASTTDNVYAASSAVLVRPLPGFSAKHIGQELDVQATYTVSPRVQVHGGYAYIIPGAFLKPRRPARATAFPFSW